MGIKVEEAMNLIEKIYTIGDEEVAGLTRDIGDDLYFSALLIGRDRNAMEAVDAICGLAASVYALGRLQGREDHKHSMTFIVGEESKE